MKEKGGKKRRGRERERRVGGRESDEESMRDRDIWGSEWVREIGRLLKRAREREKVGEGGVREREKDEESKRIGRERKSPGTTDVPKLYAYNQCEHSVVYFSYKE